MYAVTPFEAELVKNKTSPSTDKKFVTSLTTHTQEENLCHSKKTL
jgi:hypothetical protein